MRILNFKSVGKQEEVRCVEETFEALPLNYEIGLWSARN